MAKTLKRRSEVENPKYMKSLLAMLAYRFYLIIPIFGKVTLFIEKVIVRREAWDHIYNQASTSLAMTRSWARSAQEEAMFDIVR